MQCFDMLLKCSYNLLHFVTTSTLINIFLASNNSHLFPLRFPMANHYWYRIHDWRRFVSVALQNSHQTPLLDFYCWIKLAMVFLIFSHILHWLQIFPVICNVSTCFLNIPICSSFCHKFHINKHISCFKQFSFMFFKFSND